MERDGSRRRKTPPDTLLWGIIAGAVFVLVLALLVVMKTPDSYKRFERVTLSGRAIPTWSGDTASAPPLDLSGVPEKLELYLDVSYPMGGFLPFPGSDRISDFRTLVQAVPGHIVSQFAGSGIDLRWTGVAEALRPSGQQPRIERQLFNGRETRLHLAIEQMIADLRSGKVEVAALITDLVATEELLGAMGAATPFNDWLSSDTVRGGVFDLGLVGVRAPYWGVTHPQLCPRVISGLGCRYSEQRPGYIRLSEVAHIPFYVLLMGKGEGAVEEIGQAILAAAHGLQLDAEWELLTDASESFPSSLSCSADQPAAQFALFRDDAGRYRCSRNEEVRLTCSLSAEGGLVPEAAISTWDASNTVSSSVVGDEILVAIDCESLSDHRPQEDLILHVTARRSAKQSSIWTDWTTEEDERDESLGRTLQLQPFVKNVRLEPDQYRLEFEPLLRVTADGS